MSHSTPDEADVARRGHAQIVSATNIALAEAMITTQHLGYIQHKDEWKRAQTMELSAEGKLVTM